MWHGATVGQKNRQPRTVNLEPSTENLCTHVAKACCTGDDRQVRSKIGTQRKWVVERTIVVLNYAASQPRTVNPEPLEPAKL